MKRKMANSINNRKLYLTAIAALVLVATTFLGIARISSVSAQSGKRTALALLGPSGLTTGEAARLSFFNASTDPVRVKFMFLDSNGGTLSSTEVIVAARAAYEWDFN